MSSSHRVALLIETSSSYGRALLQGIIRYMRSHEEWSVFFEERSLDSDVPKWLADWQGDGIISRRMPPWLAESVARTRIPLINLIDRRPLASVPSVSSDQEAIGRLGADHLIERGYDRFAFCGFTGEAWSDGRGAGFSERLGEAGFDVEVYESPWHGPDAAGWDQEQQALIDWLQRLETPSGIMACNDVRAQQVLDACRLCEIPVPESVAVLGVDNDELLCQLSSPPLSSVIPNTEQIGYLAAEMLARLMAGKAVAHEEVRVAPLGVATRLSTDTVAIDDLDMATAVRFIRENACRGINVKDVLGEVPLSRSALERGFRKHLGRSPQQEIRNVQIKRCERLLQDTDLPMDRIATLCGFQHPEYMHVVFKRQRGMTPGQYRRSAEEA